MAKDKFIKNLILITADVISVIVACVLSMLLTTWQIGSLPLLAIWAAANAVAVVVIFTAFGVYKIVLTSVGIVDALRFTVAVSVVYALNALVCVAVEDIHFSTVTVFALLLFVLVGSLRFAARTLRSIKYVFHIRPTGGVRAMIVGAGDAGSMLLRELQNSNKIEYYPVCFVDDDELKLGAKISEVKIMGTTQDIPDLCKKLSVEEIIIALPTAEKTQIKRILDICKLTKCKVKTLPGIYQLINGEATIGQLREVQIADLLGREQVTVNLDDIMGYIENEVVLVTGGGGSIGSELCRQIAAHHPKQLIILDIYENNAYEIEQELKRKEIRAR